MLLRALVITSVVAGAGCKKEREMATELPPTPSTGHSVSHKSSGEGDGSGSAVQAAPAIDAAPKIGGNGKEAYRGDDGKVHGPGGPVNLGQGVTCDADHDHCQRGDAWFCVSKFAAGKMYRATPCFDFEGKWWTWRGDEVEAGGIALKTRLAKPGDLKVGDPVVFFTPESNPRDKWVDSEYEALTSSRWDVGVVDNASGASWTTKAWPDPLGADISRVVVEQKTY